jgi:hypothetical protein
VQGGRERNKSIALTLTGDMKVVAAVALDDTIGPQADHLAETKAGIREESDDELVAFTRGDIFDPLHFLPRQHIDELSMRAGQSCLDELDGAGSSCPGEELVERADVHDDRLPGQWAFLPALD